MKARIKEIEVALQDTAAKKQEAAARLEQGREQMNQLMQSVQPPNQENKMFDKLRSAFSNAAKSLGEKELNEKDIEDILFELEISLLESDVATEVIDSIKDDLKEKLIGSKVDKKEIEKFVKDSLISSISAHFDNAGEVDHFWKN